MKTEETFKNRNPGKKYAKDQKYYRKNYYSLTEVILGQQTE